ncbi:hypothetical protein FB45DRAFT_77891 [Roridomyces roridus]|uniref:Uncharacterized protein n=1 Tax=Roridomyces roridus TaxID=1738132 RepID=A0AAD7AY81_9AGAR|nr:hypothetical protein FB45DRAFT_77891 [Roridomyces roridus]
MVRLRPVHGPRLAALPCSWRSLPMGLLSHSFGEGGVCDAWGERWWSKRPHQTPSPPRRHPFSPSPSPILNALVVTLRLFRTNLPIDELQPCQGPHLLRHIRGLPDECLDRQSLTTLRNLTRTQPHHERKLPPVAARVHAFCKLGPVDADASLECGAPTLIRRPRLTPHPHRPGSSSFLAATSSWTSCCPLPSDILDSLNHATSEMLRAHTTRSSACSFPEGRASERSARSIPRLEAACSPRSGGTSSGDRDRRAARVTFVHAPRVPTLVPWSPRRVIVYPRPCVSHSLSCMPTSSSPPPPSLTRPTLLCVAQTTA